MEERIKLWQWPNILAVDASLVAMAWLWFFAATLPASLNFTAYAVLGLSVWLTYTADRLLDIRRRPPEKLLSKRHRFAKRHSQKLWPLWAVILATNILLALLTLDERQLHFGFVLLSICLTYTALNQALSKHFFPKEPLVAIIFAGGTQIFLPRFSDSATLLAFTGICLLNCLLISQKEQVIDARLRVYSLGNRLATRWIRPLFLVCLLLSTLCESRSALLPTTLCLWLLAEKENAFEVEPFRVFCDTVLLVGPIFYFFLSAVFVR